MGPPLPAFSNLLTSRERRTQVDGTLAITNTQHTRKLQQSKAFVKSLRLHKRLYKHSGCVNTVSWSEDGSLLVSGSDDCDLNIWKWEQVVLRHQSNGSGSCSACCVGGRLRASGCTVNENTFNTSAMGVLQLVSIGPPTMTNNQVRRGAHVYVLLKRNETLPTVYRGKTFLLILNSLDIRTTRDSNAPNVFQG